VRAIQVAAFRSGRFGASFPIAPPYIPGGGFAGIGEEQAAGRGVRVQGIEQAQYAPGQREELIGAALAAAAAGRIEPFIGQVFPLEEAARAHEAIAARAVIGKTLLTVG
jgi:NADPH:quinone reductase